MQLSPRSHRCSVSKREEKAQCRRKEEGKSLLLVASKERKPRVAYSENRKSGMGVNAYVQIERMLVDVFTSRK